jgi:formylglycine-generating enzyme required for sulfatase activity
MATSPDNLTLYRDKRTNKGYTEDLGNGVTLTLMLIPAGEFIMGAPKDEPDSSDSERPQHPVKLQTFLMGRYPITQAQWRVVASYDREEIDLPPNPSRFKGDDLPVEQVNWYEATEFCKRLSTLTGKNYHLPSEAQWEYACRAETETAYHFGPKLTEELAHYNQGLAGQTTPVGQYPANQWGLHDMHGNVLEWCQDHWYSSYKGAPTDGSAWLTDNDKANRARRGGSWFYYPTGCRSAYRLNDGPDNRYDFIGFRVCCTASRKQATAPSTLTLPTD